MNNAPIPEATQLLPLYTLAALKSAVMRDGVEVRSDERVGLMLNIGGFFLVERRVRVWDARVGFMLNISNKILESPL
jgi:hypothetical protein